LRITHQALSRSLGRAPRIAVAGLNPHAGEGGLFGREEIEVIAPPIAQRRPRAWRSGTVSGHGLHAGAYARSGEFDVVLAMYHDQG
jgi:4-hydroxythreonine-4-phosphate dehydrogenase